MITKSGYNEREDILISGVSDKHMWIYNIGTQYYISDQESMFM